jgi:hypothetical protein
VRDQRTNQYVGLVFDDSLTVRNLRRLPDDASLQQRMDILLGRKGSRTLQDGTMIRPQVYQSIVVTADSEKPTSLVETLAGHIDSGLRGTGRLVRDGLSESTGAIVDVVETPLNVWRGYREEFDKTYNSVEKVLNQTTAENLSTLRETISSGVGLVETQVIDTTISIANKIQETIVQTAEITKRAAEIPVEYVKRSSSEVVRNLAIGTVLASVLLMMYKYADIK